MAGNPFDQFDASASATGGNPFDQFDTGAKARATAPSDTDYSNSPFSAAGRTVAESAGLGAGDLIYSHLAGTSLAHEQAKTAAAAASLPWYVRYPLEAAGYTLGAGSLLSGIPEAAGITGVGAMALEGGLAGGASAALHSNDPSLTDIGLGAAGGAALGGAAGGLVKGANPLLQKAFGKAGTVDPAAAIASTKATSDAAYAALHQKPANPTQISGAISGVMSGLDPSVATGMSPGLKSTINNIHATVQTLPEANFGQVDSWQRQINQAAQRERHPTDQIVAAKISSALDGVIQKGSAGDLQDAAQAAYQKSVMAQNLADWQSKTAAGAPLGQAPLTESETYYQNQPSKQKTLVDLYQANQGMMDPSSTIGHLGSEALGGLGYAIAGYPGHLILKNLGYYGSKFAGKKFAGGMKAAKMQQALQSAYPELTGVQPTGGTQAWQASPQVGEQLKNLMMGMAY